MIEIDGRHAIVLTGYAYELIEKNNNGEWVTMMEAETEQEILEALKLEVSI